MDLESMLQDFPMPPEAPVEDRTEPLSPDPVPRVILFDIYGTLISSCLGDLHEQCRYRSESQSFVQTALRFGFSHEVGRHWEGSFYEHVHRERRRCAELGIDHPEVVVEHIWCCLIKEAGSDPKRLDIREVALYREMAANPVSAFSGAAPVLRELKARGFRLGLASNSQFYTLPVLKRALGMDLESVFDPEWTFLSYRLGFSKPDPHFFRLIQTRALRCGMESQDVLVVGNDLENDVRASLRHGLQAVLFLPGSREPSAPEGRGISAIRNFEALRFGS